jgi:nicotinamide riboside kinase
LKVALIGSHGVGKTTLCFELAAIMKRLDLGVDLVKEVARECPLPINRETTLDAQTWILHTQCAAELAAAESSEVVICDRSIVDNYAYLVHAVGRRAELDPWIASWCRSYDGLFKIPLWQPPRFDGTRDTDVSFQEEIDKTLDGLIEDLGVRVVVLERSERERWIEVILKSLGVPLEPLQRSLFRSG